MNTPTENHLKAMYDQVKDAKLGLLFAGLTVLVKDTADYINANGLNDAASETLRGAYLEMLNHDRYYWEAFGPKLYLSLPDAGLPYGIAKAASHCDFNLAKLAKPAEPGIEYEWTIAPGWHCFETYTQEIKADILGGRTLVELKAWFCTGCDPKDPKDCKDPNEPKDPFKPFAALIERIARRSSFGPGFWYPLMLYVTLLLVKTDFRTLADSGGA